MKQQQKNANFIKVLQEKNFELSQRIIEKLKSKDFKKPKFQQKIAIKCAFGQKIMKKRRKK